MEGSEQFQRGNIVQIRISNFRALQNITINLSPGINYFIAPNGHGKSSILMALVMVFGSEWKELAELNSKNQLTYNGAKQGVVQVKIATQPVPLDVVRDEGKLTNCVKTVTMTLENGTVRY